MAGHVFEVNVMRYLFLLLLLVAQPMAAVLAAATLSPAGASDGASAESTAESPAELTLIKEEACAVLAAPDEIETTVTPRGPGFVFTTVGGKGQVEIIARPSFQAWRVAIVTVFNSAGLPAVEMRLATGCKPIRSRQITRQPDGRVLSITDLGPDFVAIGSAEIQDPPHHFTLKAADRNPNNPRIAIVDTGINYTLPDFQNRIALDIDGRLIGYDFWDDDEWPFDSDPRRSAFFPLRHGSTVFSILNREANDSTIAIYRFPAEEMCRFSDLVKHIAKTPVRVVNLSMGSNDYEDWRCFESAARELPDLLFIVSAGNNGRDIDENPVYPASLGLKNMIVVSSSDAFGRLGQGSNFGKTHVDLLVPAEEIEVVDHRGARAKTGGTSYAAPRVTALLSRYLAKHPAASTEEMIAFLRSRAIPGTSQHSRYGWIPDPLDDFGF